MDNAPGQTDNSEKKTSKNKPMPKKISFITTQVNGNEKVSWVFAYQITKGGNF
jgi:hypothetical protein